MVHHHSRYRYVTFQFLTITIPKIIFRIITIIIIRTISFSNSNNKRFPLHCPNLLQLFRTHLLSAKELETHA